MINAKDLQIGNYIRTTSQNRCGFVIGIIPEVDWLEEETGIIVHTLSDENKECNINYSCNELEPIPLTEEWWLKLGGYKDEDNCLCMDIPNSKWKFYLLDDGRIQYANGYAPLFSIEHIKFVDQWQNFYFYFTGTELIIEK